MWWAGAPCMDGGFAKMSELLDMAKWLTAKVCKAINGFIVKFKL